MYGLGFFINCDDLNFGTEQNPQCGICNRPYFRHHSICDYCDDSWCLDEDEGRYERNESHQISHMMWHYRGWKFQEGCGGNDEIPFMVWYFYYDNDQLSERIVRRNRVRSKYRYWDYSVNETPKTKIQYLSIKYNLSELKIEM